MMRCIYTAWLGWVVVLTLCACAPQSAKTPSLTPPKTALAPELEPWQALLEWDAQNPDANYQFAHYYAKRFMAEGGEANKQKALQFAAQVFLTKPNDFATQTLVYGIYYQSVRKGVQQDFAALKSTYAAIAKPLQAAFFPPSLALYLHTVEAAQAANTAVPAKLLLLQALREQPKNPLLHVQYARLLFDDGETQTALAVLYQARRLEPDNQEVAMALGDFYRLKAHKAECVYEHTDDIKKSIQYLKSALVKQPESADVHYGLMVNYAHLGLAPLSLRESDLWLKTLSAKPQTAGSALDQSRLIVGVLNTYQDDWQKAAALFAQVPNVERQRGYLEALVLQGKWQQAAQVFPVYIQHQAQPSLQDLILASMIVFELNNPAVTFSNLWQTEKKARFYSEWDEALAQFWRKDISLQALKAKARNPCHEADFEFYAGYLNWVAAELKPAKAHFEKAKAMAQPLNFEAKMADVFLKQL